MRREVAAEFLSGSGIEIGALNEPLQLPAGVEVLYVDRLPLAELRAEYPELADRPVVAPDIVDDGESLRTVPDDSVDFVIANHFIEHCEDPIGTLKRHLEVVREGGIVYLAVPDKRRTFDSARSVTSIDHLTSDHFDGPERSRAAHYLEYAVAVEGGDAARADELLARRYSIHFHVWTPEAFHDFLDYCRLELGLPFEIVAFVPNDFEFLVVLRRSSASRKSSATAEP